MSAPEDIVWNTITDSAKTRFDYHSFASDLSDFDNGTMAEKVLFMTIIGHAQERPINVIVSDISQKLLLLGLGMDEAALREFVGNRLTDLPREIKAASQALAFFDMGLKPPGVMFQVRSILQKL